MTRRGYKCYTVIMVVIIVRSGPIKYINYSRRLSFYSSGDDVLPIAVYKIIDTFSAAIM